MSAGAERETEAAPKKGEEGGARGAAKGASPASVLKEHWPTALRIVELVLIVICVGLIVDPLNYGRLPTLNLHRIAVIYSAFSGYIIITGVLVFGRLMGEHLGWRMSIAFSLIGTAVFVAAGGVIIADWTKYTYTHTFHPSKQYLDMMCTSGVFAIFAAAVFLLDAVLTFKQEANI